MQLIRQLATHVMGRARKACAASILDSTELIQPGRAASLISSQQPCYSLPPVGPGKYPGKGHATTGQALLAGQVPRQVPGKWHLPALTGGRDWHCPQMQNSALNRELFQAPDQPSSNPHVYGRHNVCNAGCQFSRASYGARCRLTLDIAWSYTDMIPCQLLECTAPSTS